MLKKNQIQTHYSDVLKHIYILVINIVISLYIKHIKILIKLQQKYFLIHYCSKNIDQIISEKYLSRNIFYSCWIKDYNL